MSDPTATVPMSMDPIKWTLPPPNSTVAGTNDFLYSFITWVSIFFFVLICVLMVIFVAKYRRKSETEPIGTGPDHNFMLEVLWTVIPLVLVVYMFVEGMFGYAALVTPPADCYKIDVIARQWLWTFRYPNGDETINEFHAWKGQPFLLRCTSEDVMHAIFIPDFRIKIDIIPGRYSTAWFEAVRAISDTHLYCAEYCGTSHSQMLAKVVIHDTREEFEKWLTTQALKPADMPYPEFGASVYKKKGCAQCHNTATRDVLIGPSWLSLSEHIGAERKVFDRAQGKIISVKVDEEYIKNSMLKPSSQLAVHDDGSTLFQDSMSPFPKSTDDDFKGVFEYIKSLKDKK